MHTITSEEQRTRRLEAELAALKKALKDLKTQLASDEEAQSRQFPDVAGSSIIIRGQAVGQIGRCTGATLGTGTFRFLQVVSGVRYKTQALALGDVTAPCVNDTGGDIADKSWLVLIGSPAGYTVIVADCNPNNQTLAVAADPPANQGTQSGSSMVTQGGNPIVTQ